jgi:hypothetical protein
MKNFSLFVLLLVFSLTGLAQDITTDTPKRFCASMMIGGSFPGGDFYDDLPDHSLPSPNGFAREGVKINLLDLTYRLNRNFGMALSWTKIYHEKDEFLFDRDFYFGTGYLAGPMFFTGFERKYMVGIKLMTGYGTTKMRDTEFTGSDMAYNLGVFLYHDFNEIWRLMGSADIYYTSMEVEHRNEMKTLGIRSTSFSVGIGIRF